MKPFFLIRVEYNPADVDDDQSHRDENTLRLVLARQVDRENKDAKWGDVELIVDKLDEAIQWLGFKANGDQDEFLAFFVGQLICGHDDAFAEVVRAYLDRADDDQRKLIEDVLAEKQGEP